MEKYILILMSFGCLDSTMFSCEHTPIQSVRRNNPYSGAVLASQNQASVQVLTGSLSVPLHNQVVGFGQPMQALVSMPMQAFVPVPMSEFIRLQNCERAYQILLHENGTLKNEKKELEDKDKSRQDIVRNLERIVQSMVVVAQQIDSVVAEKNQLLTEVQQLKIINLGLLANNRILRESLHSFKECKDC